MNRRLIIDLDALPFFKNPNSAYDLHKSGKDYHTCLRIVKRLEKVGLIEKIEVIIKSNRMRKNVYEITTRGLKLLELFNVERREASIVECYKAW